MKKVLSSLLVLMITSMGVAITTNNRGYKKVEASYEKSALPTTINLNEVEDNDIRNYYQNLNSLSNDQKKGDNLLKNLKPILSNGQQYFSYDINQGGDIWKMYEITDRDWELSPETEIDGYNSETNIITGYKYKAKGIDPSIHALYVNRDVENKMTAWSNHNQTAWGINREHIWPKSHGFDDDDSATSGARGDPMHLWAGDGYVNREHNNNFYGYVDKSKTYKDLGTASGFEYAIGNLSGKSLTVGGNQTVFEPQDSDKGDIARAVFYMVARYNNIAGTDNNIDVDNPNLTLGNTIDMRTGTSTKTDAYSLGILSDLLEWNKIDPVDDYEIKRNDILYRNFTKNRNPFIDFPQWADIIWGNAEGSANPTTDLITNQNRLLRLNKLKVSIAVNDSYYVTGKIKDASNITWTIEDPTVASLEVVNNTKVLIKGLKEGTTKLTAKAVVDAQDVEVSCDIVIKKASGKGGSGDSGIEFDVVSFVKEHLVLVIIIVVVALIVVIVIAIFGSKKAKRKLKSVVKKGTKGKRGKKK